MARLPGLPGGGAAPKLNPPPAPGPGDPEGPLLLPAPKEKPPWAGGFEGAAEPKLKVACEGEGLAVLLFAAPNPPNELVGLALALPKGLLGAAGWPKPPAAGAAVFGAPNAGEAGAGAEGVLPKPLKVLPPFPNPLEPLVLLPKPDEVLLVFPNPPEAGAGAEVLLGAPNWNGALAVAGAGLPDAPGGAPNVNAKFVGWAEADELPKEGAGAVEDAPVVDPEPKLKEGAGVLALVAGAAGVGVEALPKLNEGVELAPVDPKPIDAGCVEAVEPNEKPPGGADDLAGGSPVLSIADRLLLEAPKPPVVLPLPKENVLLLDPFVAACSAGLPKAKPVLGGAGDEVEEPLPKPPTAGVDSFLSSDLPKEKPPTAEVLGVELPKLKVLLGASSFFSAAGVDEAPAEAAVLAPSFFSWVEDVPKVNAGVESFFSVDEPKENVDAGVAAGVVELPDAGAAGGVPNEKVDFGASSFFSAGVPKEKAALGASAGLSAASAGLLKNEGTDDEVDLSEPAGAPKLNELVDALASSAVG